MRFTFTSGFRRYLAIAGVSGLLVACSSNSIPPVPQAAPSYSASVVPATSGAAALTVFAKGKCKNPAFPLLCVKRGDENSLGLRLTCHRGKKTIHCGKVTWSATISRRGLRASFSPNPGNPSTETVTASRRVKPGNYFQRISWTCTGFSKCKDHSMWPITVLK